MLSKTYCDEQAARLQAGMPRFSRDPRAAKEYADALYAVCRSNDVARITVDEALESCVDVPSIADIRRMAHEHNPESTSGHGCQACQGSGYTSTTRLVTYQSRHSTTCESMTPAEAERFFSEHRAALAPGRQMIYDFSAPCPECNLGHAIKTGPPSNAPKGKRVAA